MLLNPDRYWWLMPTSMMFAFFWQFWPLGAAARQIAPDAVVMVMLYWALSKPEYVSSGWALFVGLLLDGVEGCPLGMHALALVVVVYAVQLLHELLYLAYLLICDWVLFFDPYSSNKPFMILTAISTGICWPACFLLLRQLEQGSFRSSVRP